MNEVINEKVSVVMVFDKNTETAGPQKIKWRGRIYEIKKIGYHHLVRQGKKLLHIFSVATNNLFFRLALDTENLHWHLEEIADGE